MVFNSLKRLYEEIAEISGYLWQKNWAERNAGNFSIDITDEIDLHELSNSHQQNIMMEIPYPELEDRVFIVSTTGSRYRDIAKNPQRRIPVT